MSRLRRDAKAVPDTARRRPVIDSMLSPKRAKEMPKKPKAPRAKAQAKSIDDFIGVEGMPKRMGDVHAFANDIVLSYFMETGIVEVDEKKIQKGMKNYGRGEEFLNEMMEKVRTSKDTLKMKATVREVYKSMSEESKKTFNNMESINSILVDFANVDIGNNFDGQMKDILRRASNLESPKDDTPVPEKVEPLIQEDDLRKALQMFVMAGSDVTTKNSKFVRSIASQVLDMLNLKSSDLDASMKETNGFVQTDFRINQASINLFRQYKSIIFTVMSIVITVWLIVNVDNFTSLQSSGGGNLRYIDGEGPTINRNVVDNNNMVDRGLRNILFPFQNISNTDFSVMDEIRNEGFPFHNLGTNKFKGLGDRIREFSNGGYDNEISTIGKIAWKAVNMRFKNMCNDMLFSYVTYCLASLLTSVPFVRNWIGGRNGLIGVLGPVLNYIIGFTSEALGLSLSDPFRRSSYSNVSPLQNIMSTSRTLITNKYLPMSLEGAEFGLTLDSVSFFSVRSSVAASIIASEFASTVTVSNNIPNSRIRFDVSEEDAKLEVYPVQKRETYKVLTIDSDQKFVKSELLADTENVRWLVGSPFTCVSMFTNYKVAAKGIILPTDKNFSMDLSLKDFVFGVERDVAVMKRSDIKTYRRSVLNSAYGIPSFLSDFVTIISAAFSLYDTATSGVNNLSYVASISFLLKLLQKEYLIANSSYCAELQFNSIGSEVNGLMVGRVKKTITNNIPTTRNALQPGKLIPGNDTDSLKKMLGVGNVSISSVLPYMKKIVRNYDDFIGNRNFYFEGDFVEYIGGVQTATLVVKDILRPNSINRSKDVAQYDNIGSFYEIEKINNDNTVKCKPLNLLADNKTKRGIFVYRSLNKKDNDVGLQIWRWRYIKEWKYENDVCSLNVGKAVTEEDAENAGQQGQQSQTINRRRPRSRSQGRARVIKLDNLTI